MGFDSEGNLYVTTGDTNSSQGTDGYSGNNPVAKCPTGPDDGRRSAHCGAANYSYQDARRTAGNTNDYNGKMLRFKPPGHPDGSTAPRRRQRRTTLPGATRRTARTCSTAPRAAAARPSRRSTRWACATRAGSRSTRRPTSRTRRGSARTPAARAPTQGPSTYENAAQISHAGNYGWPYCMGSKQAYRDRIAPTQPDDPRDDAAQPERAGLRARRPRRGGTEGWYDCDNLRNDSPNNTGLVEFPHQTGTGMDAGKVRANNLWWSRGNPGGNNGCPEFPREARAGDRAELRRGPDASLPVRHQRRPDRS